MENTNNEKTVIGLDGNLTALLCNILAPICCIGLIMSIIVLIAEKKNNFARFYAAQVIFIWLAFFIVNIIISIPMNIAFGAGFITYGFGGLIFLAAFAIFAFIGYNAYQGKMFEVPVIGDFAKNVAGTK